MLVNDVCSLNDSLARADCTIGLNLKHQTIIVGVTANTARLNSLSAAANWREDRVNVNESNWITLTLVILTRYITATITKTKSHGKMSSLSKGANVLSWVNQLVAHRNIKISTSDFARTINRDGSLSLIRVVGVAEN